MTVTVAVLAKATRSSTASTGLNEAMGGAKSVKFDLNQVGNLTRIIREVRKSNIDAFRLGQHFALIVVFEGQRFLYLYMHGGDNPHIAL